MYLIRVGNEHRVSVGGVGELDEMWEIRFPQPLHPAERVLIAILKKNLRFYEGDFDFLPTRNKNPDGGHISWMDASDNVVTDWYKFYGGDCAWFCTRRPHPEYDALVWPIIRVGKESPIEQLAGVSEEDL